MVFGKPDFTMATASSNSGAPTSPTITERRIFALFEKVSFPDTYFKLSILDHATNGPLRGEEFKNSILEVFGTLSLLYEDKWLSKRH
jgi:hypothetical protein